MVIINNIKLANSFVWATESVKKELSGFGSKLFSKLLLLLLMGWIGGSKPLVASLRPIEAIILVLVASSE